MANLGDVPNNAPIPSNALAPTIGNAALIKDGVISQSLTASYAELFDDVPISVPNNAMTLFGLAVVSIHNAGSAGEGLLRATIGGVAVSQEIPIQMSSTERELATILFTASLNTGTHQFNVEGKESGGTLSISAGDKGGGHSFGYILFKTP